MIYCYAKVDYGVLLALALHWNHAAMPGSEDLHLHDGNLGMLSTTSQQDVFMGHIPDCM